MPSSDVPPTVGRAVRTIGDHLRNWRRLRQLTIAEVADRAGIGTSTVARLESGDGASLENVLRVARALGVLESLVASADPFASDVGRMRADESLPLRVRHRRSP